MSDAASLFTPNNHSQYEITWHNVSQSQKTEIDSALRHWYPFVVLSVEQVNEWEQMSNNFKIETKEKGTYLLRKNIQLSSPSELESIDRLMVYLFKKGISVPAIMSTQTNERAVNQNGTLWQLFRFIPGNHFCGRAGELFEAAHHIAELHRALKEFSPEGMRDDGSPISELGAWEELDDRMQMQNNALGDLFRSRGAYIEQEAGAVFTVVSGLDPASRQVIHADLHPQNFLFDGGALTAILDFGNVRVDYVHADIANACHRLVRQFVVHQGRPHRETVCLGVREFVRGYRSWRDFSDEDIALIPVFLRYVLFKKIRGVTTRYLNGKFSHDVAYEQTDRFLNLLPEAEIIARCFVAR